MTHEQSTEHRVLPVLLWSAGSSSREEDTVQDPTACDVTPFTEAELNELAKSTGVVVIHCLGIAQCFQDGAAGMDKCYYRPHITVT